MGNLVVELVSPKHLFLNQVSSFYPNCHLLLYHTIVICARSGVCEFPLPKMLLWLILGVWKWGQKGDGQIVDNLWTTMCQKRHWVPGPAHLIMYQFCCSLVTARCIFYSASQKLDMMRMNDECVNIVNRISFYCRRSWGCLVLSSLSQKTHYNMYCIVVEFTITMGPGYWMGFIKQTCTLSVKIIFHLDARCNWIKIKRGLIFIDSPY